MSVEIVTRYQSSDGKLHESRDDAERHEAEVQILRMMESRRWGSLHPDIARWIAAHLPELSSMHNFPSQMKAIVDRYLGIPDPEEPAPDVQPGPCAADLRGAV